MLLEKIDEEEIFFAECFYNPICNIENLFDNFDNLGSFSPDKFGKIRQSQAPMLSFESMIDTDNDLEYMKDMNEDEKAKEKFNLRKGTGDIYNLGARNHGKSLIGEKLDIPQSLLTDDGWWCGFASIDMNHITGILDCVRDAVDNHPIVSLFRRRVKTHPNYLITTKNGWKLESVNLNLGAKSPGDQFIGKHFQKIYFEESSYETEEVFNKRQDAVSEKGCVFRISGMTDFTRHSPIGRQFYDPENKNKVINLPQFVNPFFNEEEKQKRIEQYGGEDNLNYKIYVLGEIIQGGKSEFDMERVRNCYLEKRTIKRFEIPKKRFKNFKDFIVVERPKSADRIVIASDIGDGAGGSDLIILSQIGNKYKWLYDIILYNLSASEQLEIFKYLIKKLNANVVGIECGEGIGRTIYRELERIYSKDNLVYYDGREKVNVDFEKDDKGDLLRRKGKPVYLQEFMSEWSVRRLKTLLYENLLSLPKDFKFDKQISSVVALPGHSRTKYKCITQQGDHLWSAFKTFAICEWQKNSLLKTPSMNKNENYSGGVSSW